MGKDFKSKYLVNRDAEGNVEPIVGMTPTLGIIIKLLPVTYGTSRGYEHFGLSFDMWSDEDKYDLLINHVIELGDGDDAETLDGLELEDMQNFEAYTLMDILQAVALYSGFGRLFGESEEVEVKKEETDASMT